MTQNVGGSAYYITHKYNDNHRQWSMVNIFLELLGDGVTVSYGLPDGITYISSNDIPL